jgi:cobalt/nickel transport protein
MIGRVRSLLLGGAVLLLGALPLWVIAPGEAAFQGSDQQAQAEISRLAPDFQPWAKPLFTPPSSEIESLLFALQAAFGAGLLGYWLGRATARAESRKAVSASSAEAPPTVDHPAGAKSVGRDMVQETSHVD